MQGAFYLAQHQAFFDNYLELSIIIRLSNLCLYLMHKTKAKWVKGRAKWASGKSKIGRLIQHKRKAK